MRIVLLSLADLTSSTADSITTLKTARALAHAGLEVRAVAPRQASAVTALDVDGAKICFHANVRRLGLPNTFNTLVQLWHLARSMCKRTDVVYVRAASLTFLVGLWCRLSGGPPVISEHHGWAESERRMHERHTWAAPLERFAQVWDARFARRVRTVVPGLADLLVSHGVPRDRVVVIGNACDTDNIVPQDRAAACASYGLDPALVYLGFLGSLTRWQGLETVLDAFAEALRRRPALRLLIVGDGPLRDDLRARASALELDGRVHFLGRVDHDQVARALGCFDIALLPTAPGDYAAIGRAPLKLREYAAAGRTVLAARVPGVEDLDGEPWLHLFRVGDAGDLVRKLDCLFDSSDELSEQGRLARRYAEQHFAWPVIIARVIDELGFDSLPTPNSSHQGVDVARRDVPGD